MAAITTELRNWNTKVMRRFNLSFWCALYNIFLFVMLVVSIVASATVLVAARIASRVSGQVVAFLNGKRYEPRRSDGLDLWENRDGEGFRLN